MEKLLLGNKGGIASEIGDACHCHTARASWPAKRGVTTSSPRHLLLHRFSITSPRNECSISPWWQLSQFWPPHGSYVIHAYPQTFATLHFLASSQSPSPSKSPNCIVLICLSPPFSVLTVAFVSAVPFSSSSHLLVIGETPTCCFNKPAFVWVRHKMSQFLPLLRWSSGERKAEDYVWAVPSETAAASSLSPSICLSLLIYSPLKSLTFQEFMKSGLRWWGINKQKKNCTGGYKLVFSMVVRSYESSQVLSKPKWSGGTNKSSFKASP